MSRTALAETIIMDDCPSSVLVVLVPVFVVGTVYVFFRDD